jgi:hypothetical protein
MVCSPFVFPCSAVRHGPGQHAAFRKEGLRIAVVRDGRAELIPVTIARDFGTTVEILSGLQTTDEVILDPADSLISGTSVQVKNRPTKGSKP